MQALRPALLSAVLGGLFAAAPLIAQVGSEGVIEFKMYDRKGSSTMVQTSKGSQVRFDNPAGNRGREENATLLLDTKAHTVTVLIAEQKMYLVNPLATPSVSPKAAAEAQAAHWFKSTGRTETVAGIPCEIYSGKGKGSQGEGITFEVSVAKGLGFAMFDVVGPAGSRAGTSGVDVFKDLSQKGYYVLKATEIENGIRKPSMEAVKVERKPVDASLFQIPAGYTKMEMPTLKSRR